jgi:FkbM family methyltransferase
VKHSQKSAEVLARKFLKRGDTAVDIGAAFGELTRIYAEAVGSVGCVLAVEPNRRTYETLWRAMKPWPQVTCVEMAVGDVVGAGVLTDSERPKHSSLWPANVPQPGTSYSVHQTTVDVLLAELPRVTKFIKIDAQGAEAAILRGATTALARPIVWVVEMWPAGLQNAGATIADVLLPFKQHGYVPADPKGRTMSWQGAKESASCRRGGWSVDLVFIPGALR